MMLDAFNIHIHPYWESMHKFCSIYTAIVSLLCRDVTRAFPGGRAGETQNTKDKLQKYWNMKKGNVLMLPT